MNSKTSILAVSLIAATGMAATVLAQTGTSASGSTSTGVAAGTGATSGSMTAAGTGSTAAAATGMTAGTGTGITTGTATGATSGSTAVTTSGDTAADAAKAQARLVARFTAFTGSQANAQSLVTGLRTGSTVTLTGAAAQGQTADTTSFTPPTKPMGLGNVYRALTLARRDLAAQGIKSPTPEQLQVALMGGTLTTSGKTSQPVALKGVLQLRNQGMGWGQVANALGIRPGPSTASIRGEDHRLMARVSHRETPSEKAAEHAHAVHASGRVSGNGIVTAAVGGSHLTRPVAGSGMTTAAGPSAAAAGTVGTTTAAASRTTSLMSLDAHGITSAGGGLFAGNHRHGR